MNRLLILLGVFVLSGLCASAQPADSLRRIGDVDTGPVTMRRAADGNDMVLEVAGFGITLGSNAIYKKPKVKNSLSGLNPVQFGVGGSVSYHGVGVYVRYGVTRLFKSSAGPSCHPLSLGVCVFM